PKVSVTEHHKLSGLNVDFPYDVYDPGNDTMVPPMLLSHIDCADAVEKLMVEDTYRHLSLNAQTYSVQLSNFEMFKK
ncbi:lipopolysaccharide biosynthesis protein, partial [Erwinia amylovora]|nr:lipopolysaccharide biosynthesis protein [Erwinia amylovora]